MYPVLVPFLFNPVGMNKSFGFFSSSTVFYEWDIIFRRTKKKNGNCIKHIFIARQGNTFNLYCTSATRKILYKLIQFDVLRTHKEISIFCLFFHLIRFITWMFERISCMCVFNRAFETNI